MRRKERRRAKSEEEWQLRLRKPKDRPKLMDLQPAPPTTSAAEGPVEVPRPGRGRADSAAAATTTTTTTPPAGEEGAATDSPATKKRHQRSRSVGKGGLMNLIGLKKKKNRKGTDGCGRHGNAAASVADPEEQSKKTKR